MTKQECLAELAKTLTPGQEVYTVLRSVSRSGMSRRMDVYSIEDNQPRYLTGLVSTVLGYSFPRRGEGLRVNGCGMDMGFHVVYQLGRVLWPNGTDYISGRNGSEKPEPDGGYCLKQRWL